MPLLIKGYFKAYGYGLALFGRDFRLNRASLAHRHSEGFANPSLWIDLAFAGYPPPLAESIWCVVYEPLSIQINN
ncbi:MAG: hypothetical protein MUE85_13535 [Microscillaceae bacterium]|nr:hypothetical protein [Microscillaceae bacterium]